MIGPGPVRAFRPVVPETPTLPHETATEEKSGILLKKWRLCAREVMLPGLDILKNAKNRDIDCGLRIADS